MGISVYRRRCQHENLLGGKGANLAEMTNIGLPVPQGSPSLLRLVHSYYEDGRQINDEIQAQIMEYITKMEEITGKKFGDKEESSSRFRSFRSTCFHAWYDGHHPQPWFK